MLAITEDEQRSLSPFEALLDNNSRTRFAEPFIDHEILNRLARLLFVSSYYHPFAGSQTVGLKNNRITINTRRDDIVGRFGGFANGEGRSGDVIARHELFGEDLTSLEPRGSASRADNRKVSARKCVYNSANKRLFRTHDRQVDLQTSGQFGNSSRV